MSYIVDALDVQHFNQLNIGDFISYFEEKWEYLGVLHARNCRPILDRTAKLLDFVHVTDMAEVMPTGGIATGLMENYRLALNLAKGHT